MSHVSQPWECNSDQSQQNSLSHFPIVSLFFFENRDEENTSFINVLLLHDSLLATFTGKKKVVLVSISHNSLHITLLPVIQMKIPVIPAIKFSATLF